MRLFLPVNGSSGTDSKALLDKHLPYRISCMMVSRILLYNAYGIGGIVKPAYLLLELSSAVHGAYHKA
jgi:hypothetical protein